MAISVVIMTPLNSLCSAMVFACTIQVQIFLTVAALVAASFNSEHAPQPRIINGDFALQNETMHQVSLRRRDNDWYFGGGHICGGCLITASVVLTAAHCLVDYTKKDGRYRTPDTLYVVMGSMNRYDRNKNTLVVGITHFRVIPDAFNLTTYLDDVALLFLERAVPDKHPVVKPIRLNRDPMVRGICRATGWGITEKHVSALYNNPQYFSEQWLSEYLKTVDLPLITPEECQQDSVLKPGTIQRGMLCAGYMEEGGRDTCQGDSGGPLVCGGVLVGISSFGVDCGKPRKPGVYSNVAYFLPWIENCIKEEGGALIDGATTEAGFSTDGATTEAATLNDETTTEAGVATEGDSPADGATTEGTSPTSEDSIEDGSLPSGVTSTYRRAFVLTVVTILCTVFLK